MNTGQYTCIEIFAKAIQYGGKITVISKQKDRMEKEGKEYYEWLKFPVKPDTEYEILIKDCQVTLCYLSGNENILETGVCYLEQDNESGRFFLADEETQYHSPIREAYHFASWKNWMNDPNGLCWFKGYYHMFYQCNPHWQEWSNMYWGHAVSSDLVHWKHLPIVLSPQKEILENQNKIKGGAFSGCAVATEEEVLFYLTRHKGPLEDCEESVEQQWMMSSSDMIHFTEETCIITKPPEGASFDFRDPKVFKIDNRWYMVLGSAIEGKGAILLYHSKDGKEWKYLHPLLIEEKEKIRCFECPDFMKLDGKYLAIGAFMCHYDEHCRYQMSRYYIGNWKNQRLEEESSGWFDFGSNCYAMQSFEHQGRRICIGWISDFYHEHIEEEKGVYGSVTLPRELHIRDGKLYITPIEEIQLLKGEILYQGSRENLSIHGIKGNAYRAKIKFQENIVFSILLGKDKESSISLLNDATGFRIQTEGVKSQGIRFQADVEKVIELEIFMDRRVVEVYVNEGETVGTKLFYNSSLEGCFELHTRHAEKIEEVEVSLINTIWRRKEKSK